MDENNNNIKGQMQEYAKDQLKDQVKQQMKKGLMTFLKTPFGKWFVIILLIIIILFIVIVIVLFSTGFIYTNRDTSTVTASYDSGVTITDENGENATTVSVEDSVKGIVYAQVGDDEDDAEYIKALSVIDRTYVLDKVASGETIQNNTSEVAYNYNYSDNLNVANNVDSRQKDYLEDEQSQVEYVKLLSSIGNDSEVMMVEDEVSSQQITIYDSNYKNNANISSNVNRTKGEYLTSDGGIYSIDIYDINKEQLKILSEAGNTYKEMLSLIYGESITVDKANLTSTEGLQLSSDGTFYMRLGMPLRTNAFYYYQNTTNYGKYLEGECAAYATCRAQEILESIESSKTWKANVNGGNFCGTSDAQKFNTSTDYTKPKAGSIVSWKKSGASGHVAIVEKVEGNIVTISEAFTNLGTLGTSAIKSDGSSANRKANCLKNACFRTSTLTIEQMKNRKSNYTFTCYIYLLEE